MSFTSVLNLSQGLFSLRSNTLRRVSATTSTRRMASSGTSTCASKLTSVEEKHLTTTKILDEGVTGKHVLGATASTTSNDSNCSNFSHAPKDARQGQSLRPMSMSERDARMREMLDERSGEGGAAGLELEDGKPVAMKRGVRDNMFRYI